MCSFKCSECLQIEVHVHPLTFGGGHIDEYQGCTHPQHPQQYHSLSVLVGLWYEQSWGEGGRESVTDRVVHTYTNNVMHVFSISIQPTTPL
jgi:hypothetical protein